MHNTTLVTNKGQDANANIAAFTESFERIIMPIYEREFGSVTGIESVLEAYPFSEEELFKEDQDTTNLTRTQKFELLGKILQLGISLFQSEDLGIKDFKVLSFLSQIEAESGYRNQSVLRIVFKAKYKDKKMYRAYLIHSHNGSIEIKTKYEDFNAESDYSLETNFFK